MGGGGGVGSRLGIVGSEFRASGLESLGFRPGIEV